MKLFASDFDGTLFHRDPLSLEEFKALKDLKHAGYRQEDLQAISLFQKEGNLFGLCTGRAAQSALDFLPEEVHLDFIISSSGALVQDGSGNVIDQHEIPRETAEKMLAMLPDSGLSITTDQGFYVSEDMDFLSAFPIHLEQLDWNQEKIIEISVNLRDEKKAGEMKERLEALGGICAFQNQICLDCVAEGCSKGSGIRQAAAYFSVPLSETAGAGDSWNDLPILETAAISFTFPDAPAEVKEKVACVVDGIAQALQKTMES